MMDLYHLVRAVNPSVVLVTELHVDAACSFLSPLDPLLAAGRDDPAFLTPAYMAGQVMLVQLVDYMALQVGLGGHPVGQDGLERACLLLPVLAKHGAPTCDHCTAALVHAAEVLETWGCC